MQTLPNGCWKLISWWLCLNITPPPINDHTTTFAHVFIILTLKMSFNILSKSIQSIKQSMESWFHILFKLAQNISGWSLMVLEAFFVWPDGKKRTSMNQRLIRQNIIRCTVAPPSGWSGPSRLLRKRQFHQVSQLHDLQVGLHGLFYYRRRRSWVKQSELSKLHVWTPNNQNKLLLWFWSNIRPL